MAEMTNLLRMEQMCVYILLALTIVSCQCNRGRVIHTLTYSNCQPKRLLSWGCSGSCQSYTRPSATNPEEAEHVCECCKHTEFETKRTILQCPSPDGLSLRRIVVRVNIPAACACTPCSSSITRITDSQERVVSAKRTAYPIVESARFSINETIVDDN